MKALKERIFKVVEEQIQIKDFESWLYKQEQLADRMDQELILELFAFNYNQLGVSYEFKKQFLKFFDYDEFIHWKVKANLSDLKDCLGGVDRILSDFYELGDGEYPCLFSFGCYRYELEDCEWVGTNREDVLNEIALDAKEFLLEIESEEACNPSFSLKDFSRIEKEIEMFNEVNPSNYKKWWQFWK